MQKLIPTLPTVVIMLNLHLCAFAGEPWQADPRLVEKQMSAQQEFNYDEAKVPEFELPNPLGVGVQQPIQNANQWPVMREKTMELFRDHVFGRRPHLEYELKVSIQQTREGLFGIGATAREVKLSIEHQGQAFSFPAYVFVPPVQRGAKAPAIIQVNNQEVRSFIDTCDKPSEFSPVADIVRRGYVLCIIATSQIDPDQADGFERGLRGFFAKLGMGKDVSDPSAWKALSAWGWGASRALDYLHSCDEVDTDRVALIGHSRGGKTALWAAAEDPRFAVVCSNNSGCGGAALSRRAYGETVARITKAFPHWFCDRFATYAGKEASLPVDQHQLIGLIAPRAVYVTTRLGRPLGRPTR